MMKIRKNNGLSLMETLLAIAILAFVSVAILQTLIVDLYYAEVNKDHSIAVAHLNNLMEKVKTTPFTNITITFPNGVTDGTANSYPNMVGGYLLDNEHITVTYANPASDPLEINITLNWTDRRGTIRSANFVTKRTK